MADISTLVEEYSRGPKLLCDVIQSADNIDWDARPITGKWSVREVVCHLADSEIVYADRMKRVIAEDNPTFFEADPDLFGTSLHWRRRPVDKELEVVNAIRAHMLPILRYCTANDFLRTGIHSLDGQMTLQTLVERITAHIPHHIGYIEEKLRQLSG